MLVDEIRESTNFKLNRLNVLLQTLYGLQIDFASTPDHLRQVFEHYTNIRRDYLTEHGNGSNTDPKYTKAVLISEAIRIYLREIAPKRSRKPSAVKTVEGHDVTPKINRMTHLAAEREAEGRGERVAGHPARSFQSIERSSRLPKQKAQEAVDDYPSVGSPQNDPEILALIDDIDDGGVNLLLSDYRISHRRGNAHDLLRDAYLRGEIDDDAISNAHDMFLYQREERDHGGWE